MSNSNNPTTFTYQSKRGRKKRRKDGEECLVCGGPSIGLNFGVHTCSPCKAFFRRNAVKLGIYEFICNKDGDCPVTNDTRRQCNCCRLAKCFHVGMNRNAIRTEDQRLERNRLVKYNRQKRIETIEIIHPVNLLNYSYQTYSSLSLNDQSLVTNIFYAYDQTCISLRYHEHLKMPNDNTLSLQTFMNSISNMYVSLVNYFKFIPEFTNLSVDTRIYLLKNNFNQIFRLNSALVVHATGVVDDANSVVFKRVFPDDLYSELCYCIIKLFPFVYDPIFLKLLFVVLIFSSSLCTRYNVNEKIIYTEDTLSIQNYYIELLWRYILYRCSSYQKSVQLLTRFITGLLRSQIVNEKLSVFISKTMSKQTDLLEPIMREMWVNEKK